MSTAYARLRGLNLLCLRGLASQLEKPTRRPTSISLTESDIRILKAIRQDIRAHRKEAHEDMMDLVASRKDGMASLKDGMASLEESVASLKDSFTSLKDAVCEYLSA